MPILEPRPIRAMMIWTCALLLAAFACAGLPEPLEPAIPSLPAVPPLPPQTILPTPDALPAHTGKIAGAPGVDGAYCDNSALTHPVGESIARNYQLAYASVVAIYCDGYPFDEILLALETEAQSGMAAQRLLERRAAGQSWDEIWLELGLIE